VHSPATTTSTVSFSLQLPDASPIGYNEVVSLAELHSPPIQIRGGCFCNQGACMAALGMSEEVSARAHTLSYTLPLAHVVFALALAGR
jgi:hypothetical protein